MIIVLPEYNYSYPGELKMMLDLLYEEYAGKPVAFSGVSAGVFGGARAVEQIKLVALSLQMRPVYPALYFANIESLFDKKGKIKDLDYLERVEILLKNLVKAVK